MKLQKAVSLMVFGMLASSLCESFVVAADEAVTIELPAAKFHRQGVPAFVELPQSLQKKSAYVLTRVDDGKQLAVQRDDSPGARLVWIVDEPIPAGKSRRYRLTAAENSPKFNGGVGFSDNGKQFSVTVNSRPVLRYNYANVPSPYTRKTILPPQWIYSSAVQSFRPTSYRRLCSRPSASARRDVCVDQYDV